MPAPAAFARTDEELWLERLAALGLRDPSAPTLLFGSHARGDAQSDSDIDALQLTQRAFSYTSGRLSVTGYRLDDLLSMAARGSLFVLHLRTDGRILRDDTGELAEVLAAWREPASLERLREAVCAVSGALAVDERQFSANPAGFTNLATFLIRTELYARCATDGRPEFSLSRAAARCRVTELGLLLDQRRQLTPSWPRFVALRQAMRDLLGILCANPFGSLEALVVQLDALTPAGAALVLRTIMGAEEIGYHQLPPDEVPW